MFTTLISVAWPVFMTYNAKNTVNSFVEDILFKRHSSINLTKLRDKFIYTYEGVETTYIISNNPNYKRSVLYLHGSGGTIHDREFICQMFDYFKVNYILLEYPLTIKNILSSSKTNKLLDVINYIFKYHGLEKDIIWGTSLGGTLATKIFNIDIGFKALVHCVSFFSLAKSDDSRISTMASIYNLTLPSNITNENVGKCKRPKLIIRSVDDQYFKSQHTIMDKAACNVKVLTTKGSHAHIDLSLISDEISSWGNFEKLSVSDWEHIRNLRDILDSHLDASI